MNFAFHPAIQTWFNNEFQGTSPPQEQGWPHISAGEHTLILAPTGSGKTLAAFLWCIHDIFMSQLAGNPNEQGVHTLYISPLKALNNDIHRNLQAPLAGIRRCARKMQLEPPEIRALVRTGDTPSHVRQAMVKKPPHILITTPESLYLLLTSERGREIFRGLRYLIVDEIHAVSSGKRGVHLSLSLERLMPLCNREPVRIGLSATQRPLNRIAAFLGGQLYPPPRSQNREAEPDTSLSSAAQLEPPRPQPRPVAIVDCGQRKNIDLKVISPVKSFSDLPEATVWPAVIEQLYELITSHKTTLVFVNMRAQSERIARQLNELEIKHTGEQQDEIALAHHGSMSREVRYDIEERLKAGAIPAVIATGSLELGIDIGSIDLVVQLEAPRSIAGGLQRVGRSGHLLNATSKGRIIPLYQSDLDDAVAFAQLMLAGDIEETAIPENCLDVLAQQIVAEVALREWPRQALFRLFTQSYCYRNLTVTAFNQVIEMLAGRYADAPLRALQPRLNWDRINDWLLGLRGSRLLATMNGGTIPDRGYYAVYLTGSNTRLGEMEEEFVFESRVGQAFYLGNHEWRIDDIQQDRIIVSPIRSIKPRPPFWKGDLQHRQLESCRKVGAFREAYADEATASCNALEPEENSEADTRQITAKRTGRLPADNDTLVNLRAYLVRQREATSVLPTDRCLVGEWFRDAADQPHLILHTCFGAQVNGLWAIGLAAALEKKLGVQVQFSYGEDGLIIRTLDTPEPLATEELFRIPVAEMEELLVGSLIDSPVFNVHFRYNAARALILTRSRPGKRIPLWLQRLRASDLLQIVRQFDDFPILAETYRDCLQDVFDWPGLKSVIAALHTGEIEVHFAHTRLPSPMASGLMFNFLAENIYEMDRSRLPGQAASVSSELLAEILNKEDIPAIVTAEIVKQAEARWQHLTPETQAGDRETLFNVIAKLMPTHQDALKARCKTDPTDWLDELLEQGRVTQQHGDIEATSEDKSEREQLRRMLRIHGPLTRGQIQSRLGFGEALLEQLLMSLHREKEVVRGQLLVGESGEQWCDRHNFAELYRRAISLRRRDAQAVARPQWLRFLLRWHHIGSHRQLPQVIEQYAGLPFPRHFFEREIMQTRVAATQQNPTAAGALTALIASGAAIVQAERHGEDGRLKLSFKARATGGWFTDRTSLQEKATSLTGESKTVYDFLVENGASLLRDIAGATDYSTAQVQRALYDLAESGLVTTESYPAFLSILNSAAANKTGGEIADWLPAPVPKWTRQSAHGRSRRSIRHAVREQIESGDSRWSTTSSFAALGKPLTRREQAERQARLLLARHGILVKEWYRHEAGLLPWYELFQVLKRLEWQGEIRRGFFVDGLSGVQFALPQAVELLSRIQSGEDSKGLDEPAILSTCDPALPLGGSVAWQMQDLRGKSLSVVRSPSNHIVFFEGGPALYCENFAARIWRLRELPSSAASRCLALMKNWLRQPAEHRPRKRIEITHIDDRKPAQHELDAELRQLGFEEDGDKLILWPSGV